MNKIAAVIILALCAGCSTINGNKMLMGMTEARNIAQADVTICSGGFLRVGMDCSELCGNPRWLHPLVLTYGGCTVNYTLAGKITRSVIFTSSDFALSHELEHAKGFDDNFQTGVQSEDYETVRKYTTLAKNIESSYGDECRSYEVTK
jgi:hypothetical protein